MLILGVTTERAEEGLDLAAVKNAPNVIETTDGSALWLICKPIRE